MPPGPSQTSTTSSVDPTPGFNATTADTTLTEALLVLRKRKWVILACIILGIFYGLYQAATQPILYASMGRIEVHSATANAYRVSAGGVGGGDDKLDGEIAIMLSDTLLTNVAREMDLANNPDFMGYPHALPPVDVTNPTVRYSVLIRLQNGCKAFRLPRTDLIQIICTTSKPQLAADIVNHIISSYMRRSYQTRFDSTQQVSRWLQGQLDDLKKQVESSQEQLIDLQKKLGVVGLGFDATKPSTTQSAASVDALVEAASKAKVTRILAESRYRVLKDSDPNVLESSLDAQGIPNSELGRLRSSIAETKGEIAQLSITLGPKNPAILALEAHNRELQRELNTEQQRLLAEAQQYFNAARANEDQTRDALEEQKNESYHLRDDLVQYTLLQRDYEAKRTLYESLLARLSAASVEAGLNAVETDIVDPAVAPVVVTITPRSSILTKTTIFGLIVGIIVAFVLESLDTGLRSVAQVELVTQLPSLSVIPRIRRIGGDAGSPLSVAQSNIGVLATSKSQFSEAFRSLRTSLLLANTGHPPKIVLVASSTPTEGKTTVATNLACILAQRETRVILIDADLRRPNVHHRFGLNGRVGLSTVLSGGSTMEDAVRKVPEVPNLDVLCSGPVPPFPTEMLSSEAMVELLHHCAGIYTHVVIDSPPILSVTDGVILARQADSVILVIRHGKSSRHVVRRARDLLVRAGAHLTGVVLNSVDITAPEYQGYYGYSGYSYSNIDSETWENRPNGNGSNENNMPEEPR
jgi:succinoglycan biosynthesis transport protein ExoP